MKEAISKGEFKFVEVEQVETGRFLVVEPDTTPYTQRWK